MADDIVYFKDRFKPLLDISPQSGTYDNKMAWLMAEMAHLSYVKFEDESLEILTKPLSRAGFSLVNSYSNQKKDTQAFLAKRTAPDMAVLCYRGTDSARDWKQDIEVNRDDGPFGGKIHGGFREQFLAVEAQVRADLKTLTDVPLYISGHSLGAALATLAGYFYPRDPDLSRVPFRACYTFGGPRVGNRTFAKIMNETLPIHRIVRQGDAVAELPPGPRFKHAGEIHYFDDQDRRRTDISTRRRLARLAKSILNDVGDEGLALIKSHDHQSYADQLGDYALKQL